MTVCIPNLLEGKLLTGVLPPEKQPPIQCFLPNHNQPTLVDIEACIDNPSLAPLGQHVKAKVITKKKKKSITAGQVYIEPKSDVTCSSNGIVRLRRRGLETIQLAKELDQLLFSTTTLSSTLPYLMHTTLVELDISRNRLTELPKQISQLTQLKSLNATSNFLTEIPKELYGLKNLQVLILSQNKIQTIPEDMPLELPNLITFRIAANLIHTLPAQLNRWLHMRHLQLGSVYGGNRLVELPDNLIEMPVLEELDISYNQLRYLPHDFQIQSLKILNLSYNQLDHLPTSITLCKQLKSLNLSKNHFSTLPVDLVDLQHLELLDISENLLCILPAEILEKMESATLLITGNPLTRPGHCDQQQQHQDAYTRILRQMMQRGIARSSPVCSPSVSHSTARLFNTNSRDLCGPNGTGCLPTTMTPSPSPSSTSLSNDSIIMHPYEDIDATIDQELTYHAKQLNILNDSKPVLPEQQLQDDDNFIGTSRSTIVQDSTLYKQQYVLVDFPRESPLQLLHSLKEIATRQILKSKLDVPLELLPHHLALDISRNNRMCAFCQGPFVNEWVSSVQVKSFAGHPAVVRRVRFCSTKCFSLCTPKDHSKSVVSIHHH